MSAVTTKSIRGGVGAYEVCRAIQRLHDLADCGGTAWPTGPSAKEADHTASLSGAHWQEVEPMCGGSVLSVDCKLIREGSRIFAKRCDQPNGYAALKLVQNGIVIAGIMSDPVRNCGRVFRIHEVHHARYHNRYPRRG